MEKIAWIQDEITGREICSGCVEIMVRLAVANFLKMMFGGSSDKERYTEPRKQYFCN